MKIIRKFIGDFIRSIRIGKNIQSDPYFIKTKQLITTELKKEPKRHDIINFLLTLTNSKQYLEIGVRNPDDNFNHILCEHKYSVDPGIEYLDYKVNFKMTSDVFFESLKTSELELSKDIKFDVIFIDGLHLAQQVERDIQNSLNFINDHGFIVLHDCNPPTEFHQREDYYFRNSPAKGFWNGTTWKAFYKFRHLQDLYSICFDTDWGIGVLSKRKWPMFNTLNGMENSYYGFKELQKSKNSHLNLQEFDFWKATLKNELKLNGVF